MITIMGAVILISASSMLGIKKAAELRTRASALAAVVSGLELLRGEMCTLRAPMPQVTERLSGTAPGEMKHFFRRLNQSLSGLGEHSFYELWSSAVRESPELMLSKEEADCLTHLGMSLGRYVLSEQEAVINQCIARFSDFYELAREESKVQGKLYAGLGVAAGLMVSVVLL